MIGKIIGAALGGKLAKETRGMDGTTGVVLGAIAPMVLRRLSLPGMIALGVGGYVAKKLFDDKDAKTAPTTPARPAATTSPAAATTVPAE